MSPPRSLRSLSRRVAAATPEVVRDALRPIARRVGVAGAPGAWWDANRPPWSAPGPSERDAAAWCNICRWTGDGFDGRAHTEEAWCPRCGSVARDRFLHWCFLSRTHDPGGARIIETSPRLGDEYRTLMRRWFDYRTSDFDLGAHTGDIQLDMQDLALADRSLDVVLTAHVLEHVPDTALALSELHRVIAPGGRMYLQVPLVYGRTAPPSVPEFHADDTPVHFNFGWDLTDLLRDAGFTTTVLVTADYLDVLRRGDVDHDPSTDGFHLHTLVEHVRLDDLTVVADAHQARRSGFVPGHHFATWECLRP